MTIVEELQKTILDATERIKKIQDNCTHSFEITSPHGKLEESLISGIYLGRIGVMPRSRSRFTITCTKCSKSIERYYTMTCPKCFESLTVDWGLHNREKVHGKTNLYYNSRVKGCPNNDFSVANDEWDQ